MKSSSDRVLSTGAALIVLALASGCSGSLRWPFGTTQRWPGPMKDTHDPLPPGEAALFEEGPEEVLVIRHADPVRVRPAGLTAAYPLTFYDKKVRVHSGSAVRSSAGGRAEVLWPNGNSIVLFDEGGGVVGSPSKGQSSFRFLLVDRARINLQVGDQIELLGGARLRAQSGPFVIEHIRPEILRVSNQSKAAGEVAFREEVFTLDPGAVVDLALLSAGGKPIQSDPATKTVEGAGFALRYAGALDVENKASGITVRALGEHEVTALGVRVRLERDEEARFQGSFPRNRP